MLTYIMSGLLLIVMLILYILIVDICRKKQKKGYTENLIWGVLVLIGAIFLKKNYILSLPSVSTEDTNFVMNIIFVLIVEICYVTFGTYYKEDKFYDLNVYLVRPTIIEMGLTGLALPYLMNIPVINVWFNFTIMGMTGAILITVACEVLLNSYKREYIGSVRSHYWSFILIGLFNCLLTLVTKSVLFAVLLRILFGVLLCKKSVKIKTAS